MDRNSETYHSGNWLSTPFAGFLDEAKAQSEVSPQNDIYIAAFAEAINDLYYSAEFPFFFNLIEFGFEKRKQMGKSVESSYMFNHILRDCQFEFKDHPEYPFEDKDKWIEAINHYIKPDIFLYNLMTREVASNIAQRYKTIKLLLQLYPERFKDKPSIIDIGCSQNHGNVLLNSNKAHFDELSVYPDIQNESTLDKHSTEIANSLLRSKVKLGTCVGIDYMSLKHDPNFPRWARACSFYPREIKNRKKIREYNLLEEEKPTNVLFIEDDITNLDLQTFGDSTGVDQADIVFMSTVLYEMTEANRQRAMENAIKLAKPNGFVVGQDFVRFDPNDPTAVKFETDWSEPYLYKAFRLDMQDPTELRPTFAYINGRCEKVVILDEEIKQRLKDRESKIKKASSHISKLFLGRDDKPDMAA